MRSPESIARKMRSTAAAMFGKRNGSLKERRRGCRKAFTSSALIKPFLFNNSTMHGKSQISVHGILPFITFPGGVRIQRLCTKDRLFARSSLARRDVFASTTKLARHLTKPRFDLEGV